LRRCPHTPSRLSAPDGSLLDGWESFLRTQGAQSRRWFLPVGVSTGSGAGPSYGAGVTDLVERIRNELTLRADPAAAPAMQAYMKSALPFRGVPKPARAALMRELAPQLDDVAAVESAATELWEGAAFREERYLALTLARRLQPDPARLPLIEHWIRTGAWWDLVDEIAIHLVGPLLRTDPRRTEPVVRRWIVDADRWLRRTSVIAQLGSRSATDVDLLVDAIEANQDDSDFFLRKAIGWALRQYASTDPEWVRAFVADHPRLSPLSCREALRHLSE
jgi:3-methyladenine DNA glycosylase AlkD